MPPEKRYLKWRQGPHIGCLYARLIAGNPSRYGQRIVSVPVGTTPERVAGRIAEIVSGMIAEKNVSAALLLFPKLTTLEHTARVMLALDNEPDWKVTPLPVPSPPVKKFVALNITRNIPFGGGVCPSEALVLGHFPSFPPTRRSPITALELFIGEPRPMGPLNNKPTEKANLAHIELQLPTHEMFESMWKGSEKGRHNSLGGKDNRAKAKASLVLPLSLANRLGCTP